MTFTPPKNEIIAQKQTSRARTCISGTFDFIGRPDSAEIARGGERGNCRLEGERS